VIEAELNRFWHSADSNVTTALRRELYERAGLTPRMSSLQAHRGDGHGCSKRDPRPSGTQAGGTPG
jgi:hypothetical protein